MRIECKLFVVLTIVCLLTFSIMLFVGTLNKQSLNEDYDKIESMEDVRNFIEDCKKKVFLNCDELLLRRLKNE